jgi:hypothetical protein
MGLTTTRRRALTAIAIAGMLAASAGLVSSIASALPAGTPPAATITLTPATGTSADAFQMSFSSSQACPGDANAGYRWHTFVTPRTNDPATLTFSGSGVPQGPAFTAPLRNATSAVTNQLPSLVDALITPPAVFFIAGSFSAMTPGDYWLGIACTNANNAPPLPNDRYWSVAVTVTASAGAGPNNFTLAVAEDTSTTTSSTSTTVAGSTTTTTSANGTTTTTSTTVGGSTSSTSSTSTTAPDSSGSTTSTVAAPDSTTPATTLAPSVFPSGGSPSGPSFVTSTNTLATTGSSPAAMVAWALLLLAFGRMAILLGRRPEVV